MPERRRYPVGNADFPEIRQQGFTYIDKTDYVYRMTHSDYKYVFLSRPRRFGKSLLTSTLKCYFEGRKELFTGLVIESLETEWTAYPVLHFDFSMAKSTDITVIESMINLQLDAYEQMYGRRENEKKFSDRFKGIIERACRQAEKPVVVLIDEYDSPILGVLHDQEKLDAFRDLMQNFYSPLKGCGQWIRFCFLTGITKFSQLSIFSSLNNIKNISMMPEYAGICGITRQELETQMSPDIDILAQRIELPRQETITSLVDYYDGYHFAGKSPDIFNPYSLLNAFSDGDISAYWFASGTPTYLIQVLRKNNVPPSMIGRREAFDEDFDAPTESMLGTTPLLYQSGYLTIKDYDKYSKIYTLDIPNREIRNGLMRSLLPYYVQLPPETASATIAGMYRALRHDDMDAALKELQRYLGTVPQTDRTDYEGHYQQVLYIIFSLMGMYCDVEVRTPQGRVDLVMRTQSTLYIIELKMNCDAATAMAQIDLKDYPARFANCSLPRVKVGINFDMKVRNITQWLIRPAIPAN